MDDIKQHRHKYKIIIYGLLVHLLLLLAVFDIYFASPIDQGMKPIKSTSNPPAKRLVLFVADGLRAEAVFGDATKTERIPFLTNIVDTVGASALVHTRVPTESRPGHVAMLAGIYEDPSALFKGWKANPVNFDSVINQSTSAWCWGSPDIVPIFNNNNLSKIHIYSYESEMEDFGKNNTSILDTWVFDKTYHFLNNEVKKCKHCDEYYGTGKVFFLHLLGIDTAGHGYKPYSEEYISNIHLVDENIKKMFNLMQSIYSDNLTAYIFTSDHGMTDWGSHGAGSDHETEVPFIAWGAGIKQNPHKININQVDIAPFISSLIGINFPVNSLGILPHKLLNLETDNFGNLILANIEQLLEIFTIKRTRIEKYAPLHVKYKSVDDLFIANRLKELRNLKSQNNVNDFLVEAKDFIEFIISGINYYHNYYKYPTLLAISFGFLMWIYFLILSIFEESLSHINQYAVRERRIKIIYIILILSINGLCYMSKLSVTYFFYFTFPFIMMFSIQKNISKISFSPFLFNFSDIILYLFGVQLLIYGFFNRLAFSFLLILVGLLVFKTKSLKYSTNIREKIVWVICCFLLAIFPTLPVMKTSFNVPMYILGYVGWILLYYRMYIANKAIYKNQSNFNISGKVFMIQFICLQLAAVYILLLENGIISNDSDLKYFSWLILITPLIVIPFSGKMIAVRLVATFFGFAPFYLLVSPNYEVLFSVLYVGLLCMWLFIETKTFRYGNSYLIIYYSKFENYKPSDQIGADNLRRAFLFMVFIFLGFFGTGNIASLNSFDPMWVRAFLTIFSPFKMMGLIILKLMVPFIFACCVFRAINAIGKENVLKMFCIILIFSELMVLQFLYLITNEGSWLDIGTSLSHFIIMETFVTILILLYVVAHLITSFSYEL